MLPVVEISGSFCTNRHKFRLPENFAPLVLFLNFASTTTTCTEFPVPNFLFMDLYALLLRLSLELH